MKITPTLLLHVLNLMISISLMLSCRDTPTEIKKENIKDQYQTISEYFKEQHHYILTDSIKTIFVLTDIGCMPCNKHFSELITNYLNDSSSVFLILASGVNIDLSSFMVSRNKVFYDRPENVENNILKQSKAIFIKNKQIDTTITIDARQIELQLKEIINKKEIAENLTK